MTEQSGKSLHMFRREIACGAARFAFVVAKGLTKQPDFFDGLGAFFLRMRQTGMIERLL